MTDELLIIFIKNPVLGKVKTRIAKAASLQAAAKKFDGNPVVNRLDGGNNRVKGWGRQLVEGRPPAPSRSRLPGRRTLGPH